MQGWKKEYADSHGLKWRKSGGWSTSTMASTMASSPLHGRRTTITTAVGKLDLMWESDEAARACGESPWGWRSSVLVWGKPDGTGSRLIAYVDSRRLRDFLAIVRPAELAGG
jgi:hypothetical protein